MIKLGNKLYNDDGVLPQQRITYQNKTRIVRKVAIEM